VWKTPVPEEELRVDLPMACGSIVHAVLEQAHRTILDTQHAPTLNELKEKLPELWNSVVSESPTPISPEELAPFLARSMENISWYFDTLLTKEKGATIAVEKKLLYPLNLRHKQWLIGYADRISQPSDDSLIIHDYKTGTQKLSEKSLARDFQATLYGAMVAHEYSPLSTIELHWHYLTHQKTVHAKINPENVRTSIMRAQRTANAIENHKNAQLFPAKIGFACSRCDYVNVCPAHQTK
jgi:RecB family exonuclease